MFSIWRMVILRFFYRLRGELRFGFGPLVRVCAGCAGEEELFVGRRNRHGVVSVLNFARLVLVLGDEFVEVLGFVQS